MSNRAEYVTGWIDTTIHDFLSAIDEPTAGMAYALITCLDSTPDVSSLWDRSETLRRLRGKHKLVGHGLLVPTRQLLSVERRHRLFCGFDEVWFFPKPDVAAKPDGLAIVGPDPVTLHDLQPHAEWMRSNGCSLGLGDGVGMNYSLRVRGVAKYVVAALNDAATQASDEPR